MKIIGGLLIVLATVASIYYYERRLRFLLSELKEIKKFIEFISTRIEHLSLSLKDIYSLYEMKSKVLRSLVQKERISSFGKETEDELYSCFYSLGTGFKSDEINRLEILKTHLEKKISEFEKTYKEKVRVFRAVAFFVGLSIVILLI